MVMINLLLLRVICRLYTSREAYRICMDAT